MVQAAAAEGFATFAAPVGQLATTDAFRRLRQTGLGAKRAPYDHRSPGEPIPSSVVPGGPPNQAPEPVPCPVRILSGAFRIPDVIHLGYDPVVVVSELLWDEANEAHIAGHEVARYEVVEVVFGTMPSSRWRTPTAGAGCWSSASPERSATSWWCSTSRP